MSNKPQSTEQIEIPSTCPNCLETGTVTIITRTIGGVVRYYYQCSSCGYRWPTP